MQQIERGIFYEDSYLGVTLGALVFLQGSIFIDAPLRAEDARSWRSTIINQRGGPNRMLVNLDAHPDRTLGTRALDCTIVAHQKAAQVFRNRPTIFKGQSVESGAIWETYTDAVGMRWASPDITFTERMSLHWGGPEVILESRPGPTPGSIWIVIPDASVVFVGDAVVINQPPFLAQADLTEWISNLEHLIANRRNYTIVSGRGGLVTPEQVRAQLKMLKEINTGMEKLSNANASPEATKELVPSLLSKLKAPPELKDVYMKRLQYGLYQCFVRRYRLADIYGQPELGEEDQ
jgi:glyoxylase-like metal-dependent hydrolase (beta-lactamase superfamily II)